MRSTATPESAARFQARVIADVSWHRMTQLNSSHWSAAGRALLVGVLMTAIFLWTPTGERSPVTMVQAVAALAGVIAGVRLAFLLTSRSSSLSWFSRIPAYHYTVAAGLGFIFGALWASEGGSAWPLVIWFFLAGVLEGIAARVGRSRIENAS